MYNHSTPLEDPPRPNRISFYVFNPQDALNRGLELFARENHEPHAVSDHLLVPGCQRWRKGCNISEGENIRSVSLARFGIGIAWATVFSHARRVAAANPINALRYE